MTQKLVTESPEKTQQHVEGRETSPTFAQSFQGGLHPVAKLQRRLGNRNVAKLIQAKQLTPGGNIIGLQRKLTVGAADDKYEQEADRVARQVINTPDAVVTASAERAHSLGGAQNQTLQTKPLAASITPIVTRQRGKENKVEEDKDKDREDEEEAEPIQAKSAGALSDSFEAGAYVETQLSLSKGRGSPLPDPVRAYMEPRFGVDFSHVHVHTGSDALQMNQAVGAQAFTHGSDIYFGEGRSPTNLELTAHELTHVIQQTGSPPLQKKKREEGEAPPIPDPSIQRNCAACAADGKEEKRSDPIDIKDEVIQAKAMPDRFPQVLRISPISAGSVNRSIQRLCTGCAEEKHQEEGKPEIAQRKQARYQLHDDHYEGEQRVQPKGVRAPTLYLTPSIAANIHDSNHDGNPLPRMTRAFFGPQFGADYSEMGKHTNSQAAETANSINVRAFTVGNNIASSKRESVPESPEGQKLLAHELTHTVQQGAGVQRRKNSESLIQREEKQSSWWDNLTDFGETQGWMILREVAPAVVPIVQKGPEGIFDWLKESAGTAVDGVFTSLMAPVRAVSGVGQQLSAQFAPMLASIQEAGAKIGRNDCSPLREAAEKIENTAERIITPIVEKLQPVVAKVKDFLSGLWEKIGAPIWDWIQQYASAQWAQIKYVAGQIQAAANWIWDKTASIRSLADQAWTWFKNKLGIGEGVEGKDGLLQWVQRKLEAAWNVLKAKLEPFKRELAAVGTAVAGVALALSPAGPVLVVGAAVVGAAQGLRWIYNNWGKGDTIVQARVYLEKTLIPSLQGAAKQLGAAITRMADSITGALSNFAEGMARAVGSLGDSLLGFAVSAVQWIADQVTSLADWAREQLGQLSQWITGALDKLQIFLQQMLNFFAKVGKVVLDIWGLPVLLGEQVWNWVPACIRDPIVDFLGPIILRQIEIFQELVKDNDAWQKTKTEVGKIIRLVFTDHDLMGAIKATFYLILRVFNLPPDLLTTVAQKALSAWDIVIKKPLDFIKNTVRALGHGFKLLWDNIGTHLEYGVQGWLFGELKEKNISPPEKWTDLKSVFFFVLDVLGLNVEHIFELLKKRFNDDKKIDAIRKRFGQVGRALDWINNAIDTTKSPKENVDGMIAQAKNFGSAILTGIAEWIAGKVAEEIAILAAGAAASAGLSEVVDIARRIYKAILTAVRWARRILDMANEALDNVLAIASGAIEPVGVKFKDILHRGMPVVIGFLADQVGLGGVGQALRDIVDKLRAEIDRGILWLIDKIKAGIEAVIGAVKSGVANVLEWWSERRQMQLGDGKTHTLKFARSGQSARLMLASAEKPIQDHLQEAIEGDELNDEEKGRAQKALDFFEENIKPLTSQPVPDNPPKDMQEKIDKLPDNMNKLSTKLAAIGQDTEIALPAAIWDPRAPQISRVERLSNRTSRGGEEATQDPKGFDLLRGKGLTKSKGTWVRMHMITAGIGGWDDPGNLLPAPTAVNTGSIVRGFELKMESILYGDIPASEVRTARSLFKRLKTRNTVIWVESKSEGFWPAYTDPVIGKELYDNSTFASLVSFKAGMHYPRNNDWAKDPTVLVQAQVGIPQPDFTSSYQPNINEIGEPMIARLAKVKPDFAREIVAERGGTPAPRPFLGPADFLDRMEKDRVKRNVKVTDEFDAALRAIVRAVGKGKAMKWSN